MAASMYACGHCGDIATTNYHTVDDCGKFHCMACRRDCRLDAAERGVLTADVDHLDWLDAPGYAEDW